MGVPCELSAREEMLRRPLLRFYTSTAFRVPQLATVRLYWGHNRIEDLYMASDAWHQLQPGRKLGGQQQSHLALRCRVSCNRG